MNKFTRNAIVAFIIFLAIAGIFSLFNTPSQKIEEIDLSRLVEQINNEEVASIKVSGNNIDVVLKDSTKEKTTKETETSLSETLVNYGVDTEKLTGIEINVKDGSTGAFWGNIFISLLLPLLFVVLFIYLMGRQLKGAAGQALKFGESTARMLRGGKKGKDAVTFDSVAGLKEAKEELYEIVDFLKAPEKYLRMGARIPRGLLLIGPPGCGKTLLAKAIANEANVPFLSMSGSEFMEMFVGVGASRVRDLFNKAKKEAPSIIFIDEIDSIGGKRGIAVTSHEEREQTLNQILSEMDGFETDTRVIIIAATNRPDLLDPALLRPGRFDRRVILNFPDLKEREAIIKIHGRNKPIAKDVDTAELAQRTPGFSGADIFNMMNEAAIYAAKKDKRKITMQAVLFALDKVMLGPERKSHVLSKKEKKIAAYHEAGHALVNHLLPNTDPVRKISIVSRGLVGGYTLKLPEQDKHFESKKEFLDELSTLLAGYVAENIIFKEITTGATNDLEKATSLARSIVTEYGMSNLGPITLGKKNKLRFLGIEGQEERNYSEDVAKKIDQEVFRLLSQAREKAEEAIEKNKDKLDKIAKRLIKKETLEREEFEKIAGEKAKDTKHKATRD